MKSFTLKQFMEQFTSGKPPLLGGLHETAGCFHGK